MDQLVEPTAARRSTTTIRHLCSQRPPVRLSRISSHHAPSSCIISLTLRRRRPAELSSPCTPLTLRWSTQSWYRRLSASSPLSLSSQIRARHALCGMIGTVCPATGTRLALLAVSHRRPPIVGWADGCQGPATSSVLV